MSQIKSSNQMDVSHPSYQSCLDPQPLDAAAGGYDPAERAGHQEPGRDPLRERVHLAHHADEPRRGHRSVGSESGKGGNVRALIKGRSIFSTNVNQMWFLQKGRPLAGSATARHGRRGGGGQRSQGQGEEAKCRFSSIQIVLPLRLLHYLSDKENICTYQHCKYVYQNLHPCCR